MQTKRRGNVIVILNFFLVILTFCDISSHANNTPYTLEFLASTYNGTCLSFPQNVCTPCASSSTHTVYLYSTYTDLNNIIVKQCSDPQCSQTQNAYIPFEQTTCSTTPASVCKIYYYLKSINVLSIALNAMYPLSVIFEGNNQLTTQISQYAANATGDITNVQFHAGEMIFVYEEQLDATHYQTTLGTFQYGIEHTVGVFNFMVSYIDLNLPHPPLPPISAVLFYPFNNVTVNSENPFPIGKESKPDNLIVKVDSTYNLDGLALANDEIAMASMVIWPPYGDYSEPRLAWKNLNNGLYFVNDCVEGSGNVIECDMGSFSFSLDQDFGSDQKIVKPDDMSFSLF